MKDTAINLGKRISDYLRARCNTKDFLLNQDCRPISYSSLLEIDETANEEFVISILNSGLGSSNY
jgi:hypothetical protein